MNQVTHVACECIENEQNRQALVRGIQHSFGSRCGWKNNALVQIGPVHLWQQNNAKKPPATVLRGPPPPASPAHLFILSMSERLTIISRRLSALIAASSWAARTRSSDASVFRALPSSRRLSSICPPHPGASRPTLLGYAMTARCNKLSRREQMSAFGRKGTACGRVSAIGMHESCVLFKNVISRGHGRTSRASLSDIILF